MRTGIGYDIHALVKGRPLWLGGVKIPHSRGLQGHSDGDVVFHAIIDACLGAAALGDIGQYFPDTDKRNKGRSSLVFVKKAVELLKKQKRRILNIDAVVVTQEPKLAPHRLAIRKSVARAFGVRVSQVGFKAKTNEGFGAVGHKKAMICLAIVSLK